MYAITATVTHINNEGWTGTRQVPTFYLDERVQGIRSEGEAAQVARRIINPLGQDLELHVCAVRVGDRVTS